MAGTDEFMSHRFEFGIPSTLGMNWRMGPLSSVNLVSMQYVNSKEARARVITFLF